jgi:hypothetical protein
MLLKCGCDNTTADALYGKGVRPHVRLAKRKANQKEQDREYLCCMCSYVRTKRVGLHTGAKS